MTTPQAKYDKKNTVQVIMKLNIKNDRDIIQKLEEVGNKQGYIKSLIRNDIFETNNLRRKLNKDYGEETVNAMISVLNEVGLYGDETISIEKIIKEQIELFYLNVCAGISGTKYVWYMGETNNVIYNLKTNEIINDAYEVDEGEMKELLYNEFNIEE